MVWPFELERVELGTDGDGDPVSSCVATQVTSGASLLGAGGRKPLGVNVALALKEFEQLLGLGDRVELGALVTAVANQLVQANPQARDRRRERASNAVESLRAGGLVRIEGDFVKPPGTDEGEE